MTQVPIRGWSNSGKLLTGGGTTGRRGKAVKLQAQLEQEDSLTTQFNVTGLADGNGFATIQAEIVSSLKGNSVRRVITVVDGASITTRGRVIDVTVRDFTRPFISSGFEYGVSILSTLGVRASINQPPILDPLVYAATFADAQDRNFLDLTGVLTVPPSTEYYIPVPSDSGVNSVFVTAAPVDGTLVAQDLIRVELISALASSSRDYDPRQFPCFVPLPANTAFVGCRTYATGVDINFAVTFGVDG